MPDHLKSRISAPSKTLHFMKFKIAAVATKLFLDNCGNNYILKQL